MLTCFNLKPGVEIEGFRDAFVGFVDHMRSIDLVESAGAIGKRQRDTIMDTDDERDHEYFVVMSFLDRAQSDAAIDLMLKHEQLSESAHKGMYSRAEDMVFICWQDVE
ncbi:MAG: hypothetical protein GY952_08915 [Rhodobacteraceae bacterium]|nr:hypothetical protein [Paracoccaceae bacterium]